MEQQIIRQQNFDEERALYALNGATLENCVFRGPADGESALKECRDVHLVGCEFDLRYPLWHAKGVTLESCRMEENTRAAVWYTENFSACHSTFLGVKLLRECQNARFADCDIRSPEFGWRCRELSVINSTVSGEYAFFESEAVTAENLTLTGKYSFQYLRDGEFSNCAFDTKDAFWHAKNVTVRDSVLRGEYLGWYSDGLTLINCRILGTQPLCYCENLVLENCETVGCDLAFEYSAVNADIRGRVDSVKNPRTGHIRAGEIGEIILQDSVMDCDCVIETEK